MKRRLAAGVASIGIVLGGATAAVAANTGWTTTTQANPEDTAKFDGDRLWYSKNDNHGGYRTKGTLYDRDKSNGRGVKFQVKVLGYSPTVYNADTDENRSIPDKVHYDGAATITSYVQIQTCQRNVLADDCSSWRKYTNPYS